MGKAEGEGRRSQIMQMCGKGGDEQTENEINRKENEGHKTWVRDLWQDEVMWKGRKCGGGKEGHREGVRDVKAKGRENWWKSY